MTRGDTIVRSLDILARNRPAEEPWIRVLEIGRIRSVTEIRGHSTLYLAQHPAVKTVTTVDINPATRAPTLEIVPRGNPK